MTVKLNVWTARAIAEAMREHDDPADYTLRSAYAEVEAREVDGEHLTILRWEDSGARVFWHDGSDVTAEYAAEVSR